MYPIVFFFSKINLSLQHFVFFFLSCVSCNRYKRAEGGNYTRGDGWHSWGANCIFLFPSHSEKPRLLVCPFSCLKMGESMWLFFTIFKRGPPSFRVFYSHSGFSSFHLFCEGYKHESKLMDRQLTGRDKGWNFTYIRKKETPFYLVCQRERPPFYLLRGLTLC